MPVTHPAMSCGTATSGLITADAPPDTKARTRPGIGDVPTTTGLRDDQCGRGHTPSRSQRSISSASRNPSRKCRCTTSMTSSANARPSSEGLT